MKVTCGATDLTKAVFDGGAWRCLPCDREKNDAAAIKVLDWPRITVRVEIPKQRVRRYASRSQSMSM